MVSGTETFIDTLTLQPAAGPPATGLPATGLPATGLPEPLKVFFFVPSVFHLHVLRVTFATDPYRKKLEPVNG